MIFKLLFRLVIVCQMKFSNCTVADAKAGLLSWCQSQAADPSKINSFVDDMKDGSFIVHLINKLSPDAIPAKKIGKKNWSIALKTAEKTLQIPTIMDEADFNGKKVDESCVMLYLSFFKQKDTKEVDIMDQIKAKQAIADAEKAKLPAVVIPVSVPQAVIPSPRSLASKANLFVAGSDIHQGKIAALSKCKTTSKTCVAGEVIHCATTTVKNHFGKDEKDFGLSEARVEVTFQDGTVKDGKANQLLTDGGIEFSFAAQEAGTYKVQVYVKDCPILSSLHTVVVTPYFDDSYTFV